MTLVKAPKESKENDFYDEIEDKRLEKPKLNIGILMRTSNTRNILSERAATNRVH